MRYLHDLLRLTSGGSFENLNSFTRSSDLSNFIPKQIKTLELQSFDKKRSRMPQKSARLLASKRRLQTLARNIGVLNEKSGRLSTLRAALFTAALAVSGIFHFWIDETLSWVFLIAGLLAFIIAAIYHRRINRSLKNHELWLEMKTRQVARMELDWEKIPEHPPTELSTEHPFAVDLGIAGRRSLFQLCNSAVSLEGGQKLLHWLTDTTLDESAIQKRQKIVRELVPQTHFRNRLYLDFANVSQKHLNGGSLIRWLGRHETPKALRWLIPLLTSWAHQHRAFFARDIQRFSRLLAVILVRLYRSLALELETGGEHFERFSFHGRRVKQGTSDS